MLSRLHRRRQIHTPKSPSRWSSRSRREARATWWPARWAPKLSASLGQSFVVENQAGATGAIGAARVKRAPADGYTILVASIGVYATNPFLQKGLQYDPAKDFDLLTVAVRAPNVLVANPSVPANNVAELIDYLKKNPDKVSFASSGAGSSDHLTAALFWQRTGTTGIHVPYKGGGPAIQDLIAGHSQVSFQNINSVLNHIRVGQAEGARGHGRQALGRAAGRADARGSRRQGRRSLLVAGRRRAEGTAEGRERQAARRNRQGAATIPMYART